MKENLHTKRIVYLDRAGLPERFKIAAPKLKHEWIDYSMSRPDQVIERCQGADVIVTNKVNINEQTLLACPSVRHVAVSATGYNIVDTQACHRLGVSVSNIPSYSATTVSEHVLTSMLSLRRSLNSYRNSVINGEWQKSDAFCLFGKPINDIAGSTFGVIGFGELGQATAAKASALGLKVVFTSRKQYSSPFAEQISLEQLIEQSDVISVHCSLNDDSKNMIGLSQLKRMKNDCILINTARGGIVNEHDVTLAIQQQLIGGIAFDVLLNEPPNNDSPLLAIAHQENVILTPHIAWASEQAMQSLANVLAANVDAFLNGSPQNIVA